MLRNLKLAVTFAALLTVQGSVPEQSPLQPSNS